MHESMKGIKKPFTVALTATRNTRRKDGVCEKTSGKTLKRNPWIATARINDFKLDEPSAKKFMITDRIKIVGNRLRHELPQQEHNRKSGKERSCYKKTGEFGSSKISHMIHSTIPTATPITRIAASIAAKSNIATPDFTGENHSSNQCAKQSKF